MSEWQPIETAPKDGTNLLLYLPESEKRPIVVGYYSIPLGHEDESYWFEVEGDGGFMIDVPATHWMPLPEPPK